VKTKFAFLALAGLAAAAGAAPKTVGWNYVVSLGADGSHVLGNPAAPVKLAEYISYTCPHCAQFTTESEGPLRIGYLSSGKVSVEVRHLLRDPIDLTVAMLTNCGPKEKFFLNHSAFMRSQDTWIRPMVSATPAQKQRWVSGTLLQRNQAIANDFRFYAIMQSRGYDRMTADKCLADQALAQRLGKQAQQGYSLGIRSTPSFTINGKLLDDTSEWSELRPQLDASQ
jgi:protein-disulfide isomerase